MITFQADGISFKLKGSRKHSKWLRAVAKDEGFKILELNYIFKSDEGLLTINQEYLKHDTYTDIITFDNSDEQGIIEGDIFISVDRVKENAAKFKTDFENELRRVLAHGVLHLCGYKDKSASQSSEMRSKEEDALLLFESLA